MTTTDNYCQHLGLEEDRDTIVLFPSPRNCCHIRRIPFELDLDQQSQYCLAANHNNCPVFLGKIEQLPAPRISIIKHPATRLVLGFIVPGLLLLAFFLWGGVPGLSAQLPEDTISTQSNGNTRALPEHSPTPTPTLSPVRLNIPIQTTIKLFLPHLMSNLYVAAQPYEYSIAMAAYPEPETAALTPGAAISLTPTPTRCSVMKSYPYYVVRSGDTLSEISRTYRVPIDQIRTINCMGSNSVIFTGQKLYLPPYTAGLLTPSPQIWPTATALPPSSTPVLQVTSDVIASSTPPPTSPPPTEAPTTVPPTPIPTNTPVPTATPKLTSTAFPQP